MEFRKHLTKYLSDEFIDDLINSLEKERTNSLLLNTSKMSKDYFESQFPNILKNNYIENSYYFDKNEYQFGKSYLFDNGVYYIIDASSLMTTSFLDIKPHDLILDMCAAPGGKSISLALKHNDIYIISNDISYKRAQVLSSNIEKLGISNISVISCDFDSIYKNYKEKFDHIILDAPCSGSAMFRKQEEIKKDWNYEKVLACSRIQSKLLEEAFYMIKNGGTIVYSTCSFSYEENEEVILNFLKKHENCAVINLKSDDSFYRTKELKEAIHLFPNIFKGEGQFICYLTKLGERKLNKTILSSKAKNYFGYELSFLNKTIKGTEIYLNNNPIDLGKISILRNGLHLGSYEKNIFKPSFHLAHYLDSNNSIPLTKEERDLYLKGEVIKKELNLKTGYYIVSFNGINLGYIKYVDGSLKNLYPKGLRHNIIYY